MKRMALVALAALFTAATAMAQAPAGQREGQRPQQGQRQRERQGNRTGGLRIPGMRMMDRPLTLSQVPLPTLKAVFKLTSQQEQKIQGIQQKAWDEIRGLMPQGQPGQPPNRSTMEQLMPKFEAIGKKADADILAALTPEQQKQVPAMLKEMQALRGSGLPMSLAGSLKLTPDQLKKLQAIAKERSDATAKLFEGNQDRMAAMQQMGTLREEARKKAMAVLNAQQKAAVEKWERDNPRRGFGGMGGTGGPGMGRPGGPGMGMPPGGPGGPGMGRPGGAPPAGPGNPGQRRPGGRPGGGQGGGRG